MSTASPRASASTIQAIRQHTAQLATRATSRVEADHSWFSSLSAQDRSWIGVLAHGGITAFLTWLGNDTAADAQTGDIFANAPRELARNISLEQTLDIIRTAIEVVEEDAPALAPEAESETIRYAVMQYSREVAFAAARVYARAAESRGAWDARLESLVVDAVVRGEPDESLGSRVNALGWADVRGVCVVVGASPRGQESSVVDPLRRAARHQKLELLVSVEGQRMIAVLGNVHDSPVTAAQGLLDHFGDGPVVVGPSVPHLYAAGRSARAALNGFDAAAAVTDCPRPVASDDLLAARAVAGDESARRALAALAREHLAPGTPLGDTARAYIGHGSLEATARALFVHTNTVRYRLGRIHELTGFNLPAGDDAFAVRLAMMLADLARPRPGRRSWQPNREPRGRAQSSLS